MYILLSTFRYGLPKCYFNRFRTNYVNMKSEGMERNYAHGAAVRRRMQVICKLLLKMSRNTETAPYLVLLKQFACGWVIRVSRPIETISCFWSVPSRTYGALIYHANIATILPPLSRSSSSSSYLWRYQMEDMAEL